MHEEPINSDAANIEYSVQEPSHSETSEIRDNSPIRRSRSPQPSERGVPLMNEVQSRSESTIEQNVEIEELSEHEDVSSGPEPVITEHEEIAEIPPVENLPTFTEIRTV